MSRTHGWIVACASVAALNLFAQGAHAQQYSLIELPVPVPGEASLAGGMNDYDQAVAQISPSGTSTYPGLLTATSATALSLAGGVAGSARFINNAGVIVGITYTIPPGGGYLSRATMWMGGLPTLLPTLGGTDSNVTAMNQLGQIVGSTTDSAGVGHGVLWDGATLTDFGSVSLRDINNLGQVIGRSTLGLTLWNGTTPTAVGVDIDPVGINDAGVITGTLRTVDDNTTLTTNTAQRLTAGTLVALIGPPNYQRHTRPRDINNAGQVVGRSENNSLSSVATLWNDTTPINLNTMLTPAQASHITLQEATAINEQGHILVNGRDSTLSRVRSYILVPVPQP